VEYIKVQKSLSANAMATYIYQIYGKPRMWFIDTPNYEIATGTIAVRFFVIEPQTNQYIYGSGFFYINNNGAISFPDLPKKNWKIIVQVFSLVATSPCWGVLVYEV